MNPKNSVRALWVLAVAGMMAACGQSNAPEPTYPYDQPLEETAAAQEAAARREVQAPVLMWIEPLAGCGEGQVSTLHWERELLAQGPVEIRFGEASDAPVFGRVGSAGEKPTGAWLKPGAVFVARAEDGKEVARAVASGPDCAG